jgi:L-threonylcarbamoyladenylate synthase
MKIIRLGDSIEEAADLAAEVIRRGGVAVIPFDTVYGFIADASNEKALLKIYKLKNRQLDKPLGVAVTVQ